MAGVAFILWIDAFRGSEKPMRKHASSSEKTAAGRRRSCCLRKTIKRVACGARRPVRRYQCPRGPKWRARWIFVFHPSCLLPVFIAALTARPGSRYHPPSEFVGRRPGGEIGRHSGLKIRRFPERGRTGSIPVPGTTDTCEVAEITLLCAIESCSEVVRDVPLKSGGM